MISPENIKRAKEVASGLIRIAEKASICVLVFLAIFVFNTLINIDRRMTKLETKLDDDLSQWGRLKIHDGRLVDLEVEVRVLKKLQELEQRTLPRPPPAADDDDDGDEPPPKVIKPEDLFRKLEELKKKETLDDYRNRHMLEQRQAPLGVPSK